MNYHKEVWTDAHNNVWICKVHSEPSDELYMVWHRHTGGCFPRLFAINVAPDQVMVIGIKAAAKAAAQMVRAYRGSRVAA